MKKAAVILDMYGVILKDSGEGFYQYVNRTFPQLGPGDIYKHWDKADIGEITSLEVFARLGYKGNLEEIQREYLDSIEMNEGFYEFAERIKKYGQQLALISNDSSEWSRYLREKFRINSYFDIISVSGDLKMKKPGKRIFQHTLEQLGQEPAACTYVDDRRTNLEAAKTLGMDTVLFNSRNAAYEGPAVLNFKELGKLLLRGVL